MALFSQAQFLNGKIAVVTGANRGIGKSICTTFLEHGATVIACVRNPDSISELRQAWPEGKLFAVPLDLADENSIKETFKQIRAISKQVDILVNNAGTASGGIFQMTSVSSMKALFETNVFGPMLMSQNISRLMSRQGHGVIINISSSTAQSIENGTSAYGSSKAALERLTYSMALELAESGIRVNAIAPGVTDTDMGQQMDEVSRDHLLQKSSIKKMAQPQDIANTALFLSSDLATHITGQVLHVDGGLNLH